MARLFLLLLGLCSITAPLLAQAPAQPPQSSSTSATTQAPAASPRTELVLLFVRSDADDALQQTALMHSPDWTIFKETGPLVAKTGPVLYALFPRSTTPLPATASADVIKDANAYLAPRGANRLELEPVTTLGSTLAPGARRYPVSAR